MAILGISSATKTLSVGLCEAGKILAELTLTGKQAFTEDLITYVEKMVSESRSPLSGISVVLGPGAYSGLRGGIATAKTLAQTLKLKIVGVSTLEVIAHNLLGCEGIIAVATAARREDFNFALFAGRKNNVIRLTEDLVMDYSKLLEKLSKINLFLAGEIPGAHPKNSIPYGGTCALVGEKLIAAGGALPWHKLTPRYSHPINVREFKA